jgi:UDP-glucuronate decarboxylase
MRKHVLVTGGAGFLGSHLCDRLLAEGAEVTCVDDFFTGRRENIAHLLSNPRFELLRHDVTVPIPFECDEIYHLACPASPVHYQRNAVRTLRTGVLGTLNMLDVARDARARILIASTSEIYGDPDCHPQTEDYWGHVNPIGLRACYDESKRCAETFATSYARQFGVEVRIARIFNTYGPRLHMDDGRVISNFIVQALRGEPITIYGDGSQTRSFCYVSDLIDGLLKLMASTANAQPINLGNPTEFTIRELADRICALLGLPLHVQNRPLPHDDPKQRCPDIGRARGLLGWHPRVSLEDGLRSTIDYFRSCLVRPAQ